MKTKTTLWLATAVTMMLTGCSLVPSFAKLKPQSPEVGQPLPTTHDPDTGVDTHSIALGLNASLGGYPLLPSNHPLSRPVDSLPVHAMSEQWKAHCGTLNSLRLDFHLPYEVVSGKATQKVSSTAYLYGGDPRSFPIPADVAIEAASDPLVDRHVLVLDKDDLSLYEIWGFDWSPGNLSFSARAGVVWNFGSSTLPPYAGPDNAGLPMLPTLVRYDEVVEQGIINHALRFSCETTQKGYLAPARQANGSTFESTYPPMGMRVRLKANVDISSFAPQLQVVLIALKKYGMILADVRGPWFISGADDDRLNNLYSDAFAAISAITTDALEVVDTGATVQPQGN